MSQGPQVDRGPGQGVVGPAVSAPTEPARLKAGVAGDLHSREGLVDVEVAPNPRSGTLDGGRLAVGSGVERPLVVVYRYAQKLNLFTVFKQHTFLMQKLAAYVLAVARKRLSFTGFTCKRKKTRKMMKLSKVSAPGGCWLSCC